MIYLQTWLKTHQDVNLISREWRREREEKRLEKLGASELLEKKPTRLAAQVVSRAAWSRENVAET